MACDPNTLMEQAKCLNACIPQSMMPAVSTALLCQILDAGGAGGGGAFVQLVGDTMTGQLAINMGTVTTDIPGLYITETVNDSGIATFSTLRIDAGNITEDEDFNFLVFRFNSGGSGLTERFSITQAGTINVGDNVVLNNPFGQIVRNGAEFNYKRSVYASGTAYTLTAVSAGVDFGTTDPIVTINQIGTYRLRGRVKVNLNGATFAANQTLTVKLRRTNNTATDVADSTTTYTIPIATTLTNTLAVIELPETFYITAVQTDIIQIFADVSAVPSAGTITIAEASITAVRIA